MNDKINEIFEQLNPTDIQKQRIWENIKMHKTADSGPRHIGRTLLICAVIITAVVVSSLGINAATGGSLLNQIEKLFQEDTVITQAAFQFDYGNAIYAPELVYVDNKTVIFALDWGVIVYDREKNNVVQAIDLQSINCVYINSDPRNTCILRDGENLVIFNTKNDVPYGNAYKFELASEKSDTNSYVKINSRSEITSYFEKWNTQQKNYVDSFDQFKWVQRSQDAYMYSEYALKWKGINGIEYTSFLTIDANNVYMLRTASKGSKKIDKQTLELMTEEEKAKFKDDYEKIRLPKFKYTGDDMAIKAICEFRQKNHEMYDRDTKHRVWIPSFQIIKRVEKNGELLMFGIFSEGTYCLNGSFLEEDSGVNEFGCIHLVKKDGGYLVKKADMPEDGANYEKSMKRIINGFPDVREKILKYNGEKNLEFLKMYIKDNKLKVRFLKQYGWDPISLED